MHLTIITIGTRSLAPSKFDDFGQSGASDGHDNVDGLRSALVG